LYWSANQYTNKQSNAYWLILVNITIYLLVADVEAAKALKTPGNLRELHTFVSYMKDKSGINGWTEQQQLLEV